MPRGVGSAHGGARVLQFMAEFVGVPVVMVGVGPGRDDVIWMSSSEEHRGGETRRGGQLAAFRATL